MSYEQFREQCAKEIGKLDCAHGCGVGKEIEQKILSMTLPEVTQEPALFQYRVSSNWSISQQWTRWAECGEIAYYDFIKLSKKHPDAYQVRALYDFPPDAETLRKENEQLRETLLATLNILNFERAHGGLIKSDESLLARIDTALKGGAA